MEFLGDHRERSTMTAQAIPFPVTAPSLDSRVISMTAAGERVRSRPLRFRLAVLGLTVGEVVDSAGGWLFDRSLAGWDVTVAVSDLTQPVAVQILGAHAVDLGWVISLRDSNTRPDAVAVSADLLECDERLRAALVESLENSVTEVWVWGGHRLAEFSGRVELTEHHLSRAAKAFKRTALAAAGRCNPEVSDTEVFHDGQVLWAASPGLNLIPV